MILGRDGVCREEPEELKVTPGDRAHGKKVASQQQQQETTERKAKKYMRSLDSNPSESRFH